jgi:hypothetical protein
VTHPNFVMWKWGSPETGSSLYGRDNTKVPTADHVNRMASMIRRNWPGYSGRLICVTDDPEGINDSVETVQIWQNFRKHGKCYLRLRCFDPAVIPLLGEDIVSIDLDAVITGDLRPLFENESEPFRIWKIKRESRSELCGSMWRLRIGYRPDIFADFDPEIALQLRRTHGLIGSDQAWMAYKLGGDVPGWGERDGIFSFRFHAASVGQAAFSPRNRRGLVRQQTDFPKRLAASRIWFFHGPELDPSLTHLHLHHGWIPTNWC